MDHSQFLFSLPIFAMVLLTFIILVSLARKRFMAAKKQTMDISYYKLYQGNEEPAEIRKIARNFENLFEMPVLFYVAILLTISLKIESQALLFIAWGYVLVRYIHSYVHCTSNRIIRRFQLFLVSCIFLLAYWLVLLGLLLA